MSRFASSSRTAVGASQSTCPGSCSATLLTGRRVAGRQRVTGCGARTPCSTGVRSTESWRSLACARLSTSSRRAVRHSRTPTSQRSAAWAQGGEVVGGREQTVLAARGCITGGDRAASAEDPPRGAAAERAAAAERDRAHESDRAYRRRCRRHRHAARKRPGDLVAGPRMRPFAVVGDISASACSVAVRYACAITADGERASVSGRSGGPWAASTG